MNREAIKQRYNCINTQKCEDTVQSIFALVFMQYDEPVYFLPPATVNRAPCLFPGFFRLFPLFVGLYHRFHLFRAKDPLDPCIIGGT